TAVEVLVVVLVVALVVALAVVLAAVQRVVVAVKKKAVGKPHQNLATSCMQRATTIIYRRFLHKLRETIHA
ncbi:MAG: hypothetical protein ACI9W1_001353, partial [Candidatus Azotimanducaceae bacterium]